MHNSNILIRTVCHKLSARFGNIVIAGLRRPCRNWTDTDWEPTKKVPDPDPNLVKKSRIRLNWKSWLGSDQYTRTHYPYYKCFESVLINVNKNVHCRLYVQLPERMCSWFKICGFLFGHLTKCKIYHENFFVSIKRTVHRKMFSSYFASFYLNFSFLFLFKSGFP